MVFNCNKSPLSEKRERIFIASPFFNEPQLALVKSIEAVLEDLGHEYWSARQQHSTERVRVDTPERAEEVFDLNIRAMQWATTMVAVGDWLCPTDQQLFVGTKALNIPDSGTVFEIGYFNSLWRYTRPPIVLYTEAPTRTINLMLTQSVRGVVDSLEKLRALLSTMDWDSLAKWKGGHL